MPVFLNAKNPGPERRSGLNWPRLSPRTLGRTGNAFLHIGLVNNMADAAMGATEHQFLTLLDAASGDFVVHVTLYALPEVERKAVGQRRVGSFYWSIEQLWEQSAMDHPDGLIITGREPLTPDLRQETYWPRLKDVLAWTQEHARSSVWSCLAAHAAVLALDGIERVRRKEKHFGNFNCEQTAPHPLLLGAPAQLSVPHSRWNGLSSDQLAAKKYQVLTRTSDDEVDTFVKQDGPLFVFFQGHPEYEPETLLGEYRRDVRRYLNGEMTNYPLLPVNYFEEETERSLREIEAKARASRQENLISKVYTVLEGIRIPNTWRSTAVHIYRNWLKHLFTQKHLGGYDAPLPARKSESRTPETLRSPEYAIT